MTKVSSSWIQDFAYVHISGFYEDTLTIKGSVLWSGKGGYKVVDVSYLIVRCREAYYVDVAFGTKDRMKHFFLQVDTGSGVSWVHCKFGKGQISHLVKLPSCK